MDRYLDYQVAKTIANYLTKYCHRYYTTIRVGGRWVVTDKYSKG